MLNVLIKIFCKKDNFQKSLCFSKRIIFRKVYAFLKRERVDYQNSNLYIYKQDHLNSYRYYFNSIKIQITLQTLQCFDKKHLYISKNYQNIKHTSLFQKNLQFFPKAAYIFLCFSQNVKCINLFHLSRQLKSKEF